MTRRGDRFKAPSIAGHHVAINELEIGIKVAIASSIETRRLIEVEFACSAMRALAESGRPRCGLDARCSRRMVAMSMRDDDMRDRLVPNGSEERLDMRFVERPGIDDGNTTTADNIAHRSLEGERSGIVAEQPAHARIDLFDPARRKVEALVKRDIVTHRTTGGIEVGPASSVAPLTPPLRRRTSPPWPTSRSLPR